MKIQAAVATGIGLPFEIRTVELDEPRDEEILVRIAGVGVCHTDLVFKDGGVIPAPVVLGHEGAGIVEKIGANIRKVAVGDRVAITFRSCGTCPRRDRGDAAYCHSMPLLNYAGMRPDGSKAIKCDEIAVGSNFFGQSSFATSKADSALKTAPKAFWNIWRRRPFTLRGPEGNGFSDSRGTTCIRVFGITAL